MEVIKKSDIPESSFEDLKNATSLTRQEKAMKLASKLEGHTSTQEGIEYLFSLAGRADSYGLFKGTNWDNPSSLVPSLVRGTLMAGAPTSTFEIMSDLRILAIAKGIYKRPDFSSEEANSFLEDVIVQNLDFALGTLNENARIKLSGRESKKTITLFEFLVKEVRLDGIKSRLADEIHLICAQRPVETQKTIDLIRLIRDRLTINGESEVDERLDYYINAAFHPTPLSKKYSNPLEYKNALSKLKFTALEKEGKTMGDAMDQTGLVSPCHLQLLIHAIDSGQESALIKEILALSQGGLAEWEEHREWLLNFLPEVAISMSHQSIYGLSRMLNKSLFSRRAVKAGLNNMRKIKVHSLVTKQIRKSLPENAQNQLALPFLLSGMLRILGQPLGVGQGNNPTCQSARGISLWSRHAPAKLIDMVITVATQNRLIMRFENVELNSNQLGKGLVDKLDPELDVVSAVLVPHLDKIYNEMMLRASARFEDPHKWVNPALYGHWIQVGFASAYDYLTNSIKDFDGFVRLFYSSFHPDYNGGKMMTYPCPLGIFITSAQGEMLGFHAISLLRVKKNQQGEVRAYFLNPNNEGRQNWGQEIKPSVFASGEEAGESSLPFHQLVSRIYAFHFHPVEHKKGIRRVADREIKKVFKLANASWGKKYNWIDIPKTW